jgi:hypothetical protein
MSEKSEKPIIFSGPMVRAIMEGRKTQTRRAVKPQPGRRLREAGGVWTEPCETPLADEIPGSSWGHPRICPYETGMTLWVREAWDVSPFSPKHDADGRPLWDVLYPADGVWRYRISGARKSFLPPVYLDRRSRPPVNMPRWASRLTLRVTGVRCERLTEITGEDAKAEGFASTAEFREAWDSLYKKRGLGWDANPWVWAVGFEVLAAGTP